MTSDAKYNRMLVQAIKNYQSCPFVHELTCGNDSRHESLRPIIIKGKVNLFCPDCDYIQTHIPSVVWHSEAITDDIVEFAKKHGMEYNKDKGNII